MSAPVDQLKQQLLQLKSQATSGALSDDGYREAAAPLERALLEAVLVNAPSPAPTAASSPVPPPPSIDPPIDAQARPSWRLVLAVATFVVAVGAAGYAWKGEPAGWRVGPGDGPVADAGSGHELTPQQISDMADRLAQRLQKEPDNIQGWGMLARSYAVLARYGDAAAAYKHYTDLQPNDAQAWADYADVTGMLDQRSLDGEPEKMIQRALALDGNNFKALALSGSLAYTRKDYALAVTQWEHARAVAPAGSDLVRQIQSGIDDARRQAAGSNAAPADSGADQTRAGLGPASDAFVAGTVDLAPALRAKAAPQDTVFVFARALEGGPRMPLAILRKQVKDLPLAFRLDDRLAMSPQARLSTVSKVVIGVRVSKSGNAMAQAGDLEGHSQPVAVGTPDVRLSIDTVAP